MGVNYKGTKSAHTTSADIDHGLTQGLGDDDHTQYFLADGTRTITGDITTSSGVTLTMGTELVLSDNGHTIGDQNSNTAGDNFIFGFQNTASSAGGLVLGSENTSTALVATAIGNLCDSTSLRSTAIGFTCVAEVGDDALAMGTGSTASSKNSVALGNACTSNGGNNAVSAGRSCTASALNAVAVGKSCNATAAGAVAVGKGLTASGTDTAIFGTNNGGTISCDASGNWTCTGSFTAPDAVNAYSNVDVVKYAAMG